MAEIKWTEEQLQAINEKGSNILVAAAAGSGKTAILVERIINKVINENVDIDKILIVTFTSAAASEIRERILDAIYKKLEVDPKNCNLQKQINLINKANISTIHSFCLDVIRNNFYELDIPNNFRVADVSEIELLKYETIEEIFEEKYLNNDKDFVDLVNTYTGYRDDEELQNLVLDIYKFIQSMPFPEKWLDESVEAFKEKFNDIGETIWGQVILKNIQEQLSEGILQLKKVEKELNKFVELDKYSRVIGEDILNLQNIERTTNSWDETFKKIDELKWTTWPSDKKIYLDIKDRSKEIRDKVKDIVNKSIKKIICYNSKQANEDLNIMYETLYKLKNLIIEFIDRFSNKKKEKNIVDFNDIEHFALRILVDDDGLPSPVAKKYQDKFNEIDIDEYQDSNLVQEYILKSVSSGNNIFMVGDVKQSIYKFRQARPELFIDKYKKYDLKNDYSTGSTGLKIQLFKNFRSRENILNITNLIFKNIMSENIGEIKYSKEEYLNYSAGYNEPEEKMNYAGKTELHIIDLKQLNEAQEDENEEIEKIENTELEAKFVANKIKKLINSNYMVFDKKKGYRPLEYRDIVILLRATANRAEIFEKELNDLNIPVFSDSSTQYLNSMEIQLITSILKVINNPIQDIPLVTVLRSIVGNFTDNDLLEIRLVDRNCSFYESMLKAKLSVREELKQKIDGTLDLFDKWREQAQYLPLDELIWQIYLDTNLLNIVGVMPNGTFRQANLKMLFEKAKEYESASLKGLFNFINFIDKLKDNNGDFSSAKLIGENENVIRIMSIHKSKGLEFPVVILACTGKGFNMRDLNGNILLHQDIGIGPKLIDVKRRIQYDTLAKQAIKIRAKSETLSEEERILYVALTRAKEKLIITGLSKDLEKSLKQKQELLDIYDGNEESIDYKLIKKYSTFLDWIELVYLKSKNVKECIELKTYSKDMLMKELVSNDDNGNTQNIKEKIEEKIKEKIKEKNKYDTKHIKEILNWKYEYINSIQLPTKSSVTHLKEDKIEEVKLSLTPKFLEEKESITPAQKGTLIHLCIQKLNEKQEYTKETIKQFVENLFFKEIITKAEMEAIDIETLYKYTKSDLWQELKEAKKVYKEQPFYINIAAKEIYDDIDTEEKILVQGIIDLYYISRDNKLILVDFKTDHVFNEEEFKNRYNIQLQLYKKAIENSLKNKVDETYIYSTTLGKLISIF